MSKDDFKFSVPLRVRWAECDPQGIVFNGVYFNYIEVGLAEYLRNLGIELYQLSTRGYFGNAVVKITLDFRAPAFLDDMLEVCARICSIGNTSFTMVYEIYRHSSPKPILEATVVYVSYDSKSHKTRPMPDDIRELMTHFEETGEILPRSQFPNLLV